MTRCTSGPKVRNRWKAVPLGTPLIVAIWSKQVGFQQSPFSCIEGRETSTGIGFPNLLVERFFRFNLCWCQSTAGCPLKIAVKRHKRKVVLKRCGILVCIIKIEAVQFHGPREASHLGGIESDHRHRTVDEEIFDETAEGRYTPETAEDYTNGME